MHNYADARGFKITPPSGSWPDALILFLKDRNSDKKTTFTKIRSAILDPRTIETAVVGGYIHQLYNSNITVFNKLLNVFMGILIENFISSVSEVGSVERDKPVFVFYDTAVILRLLGCSGRMLRIATEELTIYLQDLGFRIHYFSGNEAEVANIFDTIIYLKDSGKEIEGETALAIADNEISITDIRGLQNTFPEKLASLGVFPSEQFEKDAFENARYQIDEKGFSEYLFKSATNSGKAYSHNNRVNDSSYLGNIVRLRKRISTRDLAGCGYIFVTTNRFLAKTSRRYLLDQGIISRQHCPPIMHTGQIATIAWLMKDQTLQPEKAGRELLANCFAAVRPDAEWFKYFREGIEAARGSAEEFGRNASNALTLQAARRIAQEESFGNSAIMRELNMVEILERAGSQHEQQLVDRENELQRERELARIRLEEASNEAENARVIERAKAEQERVQAVREALDEATRAQEIALSDMKAANTDIIARFVLKVIRIVAVLLFLTATILSISLQFISIYPVLTAIVLTILAVPNFFSLLDLLGVRLAEKIFVSLKLRIARSLR